jgi:hypothetical protein
MTAHGIDPIQQMLDEAEKQQPRSLPIRSAAEDHQMIGMVTMCPLTSVAVMFDFAITPVVTAVPGGESHPDWAPPKVSEFMASMRTTLDPRPRELVPPYEHVGEDVIAELLKVMREIETWCPDSEHSLERTMQGAEAMYSLAVQAIETYGGPSS